VAALFSRRTRRITVAVATVVLFLVLAGVTFQSVSNAVERRRNPHPGRLVDIGGHQLHLYCVGKGAPVVVLESPAGGVSTSWAWVQDDLRSIARVCSYDRSGLAWSEAGDNRFAASQVPDELHTLLEQAGERGPFVFAGQEIGAAFARLYAVRYPQDVRALVLVDDPAEGSVSEPVTSARTWPWFARVGLLRITRSLSRRAHGLPSTASSAAQAFLNRPDHLTRSAAEIEALRTIASIEGDAEIDPAIAVSRVTVGRPSAPVILASSDQAAMVTHALRSAVERARVGRVARPSPER
jgi:pimeloyl-ACP methyl ester carboxylesterase